MGRRRSATRQQRLLRVAAPWRGADGRERLCERMARLDHHFAKHVAQASALATLGAAVADVELGVAPSEAEAACDAAVAARVAAEKAADARESDTARARRARIDGGRAVRQWAATERDAMAVATSVGGLGKAIAGATGQASWTG